jgi:hypothetical protein
MQQNGYSVELAEAHPLILLAIVRFHAMKISLSC